MGAARNRKAEIAALKERAARWARMRPEYLKMMQEDNEAYLALLYGCTDLDAAHEIVESGQTERLRRACVYGAKFVLSGIATLDQIKDAAWEAYNGLLEACSVQRNIEQLLGLEITPIMVADFVIVGTGKDMGSI